MISFWQKLLVLVTLIVATSWADPFEFQNEEDLYRFYEAWARSENEEAYRAVQGEYMKQLMNTSADPCDDFYEFACGNFSTVVPKNNTWSSLSMVSLITNSQQYLQRRLLEDNVTATEEEVSQKVKIFHQSCMDYGNWNRAEIINFVQNFAVWPILHHGDSSEEDFDWLNLTAHAAQYDIFPMFRTQVVALNGTNYVTFSMARDRLSSFWTILWNARSLSIDLREKSERLEEIYDFVNKLSNIQDQAGLMGSIEEIQLNDLQNSAPEIDFKRYLQILSGKRSGSLFQTVVVREPIYFEDLSSLLAQTDPKIIANYVLMILIENAAMFIQMSQTGVMELCSSLLKETMLPAFYNLFSQNFYDDETHSQIKNMIDDLQESGRKVINESEWLTAETKTKALDKISVFKKNIGMPDAARSTSDLQKQLQDLVVTRNSFPMNFVNSLRTNTRNSFNTVGQPSKDFLSDSLQVNAFFLMTNKGVMEVPAAIIQPPFFHKYSAKYANYGTIGSIIGHEIMHGFDVEGIRYDEKGNPGIWWDPRISSTYYTRAECFLSQYNKYKVGKVNMTVDGWSTIGENIADNEGLKLSYNAYKTWLESNIEDSNLEWNGQVLTKIQSFFLSFAQAYCMDYSNEDLEDIMDDEHSPSWIRVLGTLSNFPQFAEAYNCPVGSRMHPEQKCKYLRK